MNEVIQYYSRSRPPALSGSWQYWTNNMNMNTANQRAIKLPFQEYVSTLGKTRKSKLWAEIRLVTGKDKTTIWRWAHGHTRPDKSDRDNIAFCVYKFSENRLPGDALFPEDYPYKGTHAKVK